MSDEAAEDVSDSDDEATATDSQPSPRAAAQRLPVEAKALVAVCLVAAAASTAALSLAYEDDWTADSDGRFPSADGALLGVAFAAVPATLIGVWLAFGDSVGGGEIERRAQKSFMVLTLLPALVLSLVILPQAFVGSRQKRDIRKQAVLFALLAVIVSGSAALAVWGSIARVASLPRLVSPAAVAKIGSVVCLLVLVPLGVVLPLLLTRNGAAATPRWTRGRGGGGKQLGPPFGVTAAVIVPYAALLGLIEPLALCLAGVPLGGPRPAAAHLRLTLAACVGAVLAACLCELTAVERTALAAVAGLTPLSCIATASLASMRGNAGDAWKAGTWGVATPAFLAGVGVSNLGSLEAAPAMSAALYGLAAVTVAILALTSNRTLEAVERLEISQTFNAIFILPWWLTIAFRVEDAGGTLLGAVLGLGGFVMAGVVVSCAASKRKMYDARLRTADVVAMLAPVLLVASIGYLAFSLVFTRMQVGGVGVITATFLFAPWAVYDDSDKRPIQEYVQLVWLPILGLLVLLALSLFRDLLDGRTLNQAVAKTHFFTAFAQRTFAQRCASELKAGFLWLLVVMPGTGFAHAAVAAAARAWRLGSATRERELAQGDSVSESYYVGLIADAQSGAVAVAVPQTSKDPTSFLARARAFRDRNRNFGWLGADDAGPAFGAGVCILFLVPFGVLAPICFLARGVAASMLVFNKSGILAYLGFAVVLGVTMATAAANSNMERLKAEEHAKVATFALRLQLRRQGVVASAASARALHDLREAHLKQLQRLVPQSRGKEQRRLILEDAADAAMYDDLMEASERCADLIEAYENANADAVEEIQLEANEDGKFDPGDTAPHGLTLRRNSAEMPRALAAVLSDDACRLDESRFFWRASAHQRGVMALLRVHDYALDLEKERNLELARAKKAYLGAPKVVEEMPEVDEEDTLLSKAPWACCCAKEEDEEEDDEDEPVRSSQPGWFSRCCKMRSFAKVSPEADSGESQEAVEACALRAKASVKRAAGALAAVRALRGAAFDGAAERHLAAADDAISANSPALLQPPLEFARSCVAAAERWRLVREALPLLVGHKWFLKDAPRSSTVRYRQGLLPRAFCGYARRKNGKAAFLDADGWRALLRDAHVIKTARSPTLEGAGDELPQAKAEAIHSGLAQAFARTQSAFAAPSSAVKASLDYSHFRQAMRSVAQHLYPKLPEQEALQLLGQKHIFPHARLSSNEAAFEAGLLSAAAADRGPRLLDFLGIGDPCGRPASDASIKSLADMARRGADGKAKKTDVPAVVAYGWRRKSVEEIFDTAKNDLDALEACLNLAPKAAPWKRGPRRPNWLEQVWAGVQRATSKPAQPEEHVEVVHMPPALRKAILALNTQPGSPFAEADLEALSRKASLEAQGRLKLRGGRCGSIFDIFGPKASALGEAQIELELLKAGAEASAFQETDDGDEARRLAQEHSLEAWPATVAVIVGRLRASADFFSAGDGEQRVHVQLNADNAFACFDVVMEVFVFTAVGFRGAGALTWELDSGGDDGKKNESPLARIAAASLGMFDEAADVNVKRKFWAVVLLCMLTPVYLRKGVSAAREHKIGLGSGGSKLRMCSGDWWYFYGLKALNLTFAGVMTTLLSVFMCDKCGTPDSDVDRSTSHMAQFKNVKCTSFEHTFYMALALIGLVAYYPLMAYIQPQLQFKAAELDLKFQPSYLVIAAQAKLVLALAVNYFSEKRTCVAARTFYESQTEIIGGVSTVVDVAVETKARGAFQDSVFLLIFAFFLAAGLAVQTAAVQPCIVPEFNVVRAAAVAVAAAFLAATVLGFLMLRGGFTAIAQPAAGLAFAVLVGLILLAAARNVREIRARDVLSPAKVAPENDTPRFDTPRSDDVVAVTPRHTRADDDESDDDDDAAPRRARRADDDDDSDDDDEPPATGAAAAPRAASAAPPAAGAAPPTGAGASAGTGASAALFFLPRLYSSKFSTPRLFTPRLASPRAAKPPAGPAAPEATAVEPLPPESFV
ncbi:hypothetical protein M885DRAFT_514242 [Pelagophyceae sp. CCMP2097]|nr:hypothetical protein M885DRAFT_514242 [Pelagophyceae sp. CCMP2097]